MTNAEPLQPIKNPFALTPAKFVEAAAARGYRFRRGIYWDRINGGCAIGVASKMMDPKAMAPGPVLNLISGKTSEQMIRGFDGVAIMDIDKSYLWAADVARLAEEQGLIGA